MKENTCSQCGAPLDQNDEKCKYCGTKVIKADIKTPQNAGYQTSSGFVSNTGMPERSATGYPYEWPIKNKVVAGVLAILLGGFGIHKFYLGKIKTGILYLFFCWTPIPYFVGFIEGIVYLTTSDHNFQIKNKVRLN